MLRLATALAFLATPGLAEITVTDARLVAAFANAKAGALYLKVEADAADMLIGVHSPEAATMLHETVEEDGVMRMAPVAEVLLEAGAPMVMEPGGLHIMVMGLSPDLLNAETLPVNLIFREAGEVRVEARVQIGIDADGDLMDGDHGEGDTE